MNKVSVVIPLYNKAPYVTKALESVIEASHHLSPKGKSEVECIIVNDGSTDNSAQLVQDWLSLYSPKPISPVGKEGCRFRLVNKENGGVSSARNRGMEESTGEYIAFLDADDWWDPMFLKEMVKLTEEYPEAGIYASNYIYYKPGKTRVGVKQVYGVECMAYSKEGWSGYINYPRSYYENGEQVVWTGAVMLRRSILEKPEIRNEKGEIFSTGIKLGEDFLLWLRLALSYPVAFLNKPLAYYNNELSGSLRLTGKLHKPEANMLWHLDDTIGQEGEKAKWQNGEGEDWIKLFDRLRVMGIYSYWLAKEYHDMARVELKKVDWTMLNDWSAAKNYQKQYQLPVWLLRWRQYVLTVGSYIKSKLKHK